MKSSYDGVSYPYGQNYILYQALYMLFYCCKVWNVTSLGSYCSFCHFHPGSFFFFYLRSWPLDFRYYVSCFDILVMFHKHKDFLKRVLFDVLVLQVLEDEKLQNPCKSIIAVNVEPQARLVMGTPFCSCFLSLWAGQQVREIRLWGTWQNLGSESNSFLTAVCYFLTHHCSNPFRAYWNLWMLL